MHSRVKNILWGSAVRKITTSFVAGLVLLLLSLGSSKNPEKQSSQIQPAPIIQIFSDDAATSSAQTPGLSGTPIPTGYENPHNNVLFNPPPDYLSEADAQKYRLFATCFSEYTTLSVIAQHCDGFDLDQNAVIDIIDYNILLRDFRIPETR